MRQMSNVLHQVKLYWQYDLWSAVTQSDLSSVSVWGTEHGQQPASGFVHGYLLARLNGLWQNIKGWITAWWTRNPGIF